MASYLILTPSGDAGRNHEKTRFIRDGFSWLAFLFPAFWLLWHRLWFLAIAAFLVQGIAIQLLNLQGLAPAGYAVLFGVHLLTALEGRRLLFSNLVSKGWEEQGLVSARGLSEAEDIYFSNAGFPEETDIPVKKWDIPPSKGSSGRNGAALGLLGYDGGR
ncbi:MAG TPA: DUF2628 domain-containing protein [Rhizobium sp.]